MILYGGMLMCCNCQKNKLCKILFSLLIVYMIAIIFILAIFLNQEQQKSILTATAQNEDNTQVGTAIIRFSQNQIVEGNALSHEEGSDTIFINETGIYQISYQLYGERQTIGTFNFNAVLLVNDVVLENTLNETPILRDNVVNRMTLTSTVILQLNAGDRLQLGALSIEDIIYTRARIDIEKIK